jgi:hypothetical protein
MAELNFDATKVAPDTGYDVVPAGWYNVVIDESEIKPTKDGMGAYLNLRFNVVDGQYSGRKIFSKFNIKNNNPQAQEIAFKQLSAVAHAVGVLQVADSQMLHDKPLKVKVRIKKDKDGQYDDQNEITSYKNINEQVDMAGASPATSGSMFQPVAKAVPPIPAPAAKPIPAAAPAVPQFEMAAGETFTREQYHAAGWTDEALIREGKMKSKTPPAAAPAQPWAQPPAPAAAPVAPAAPTPAPQPAAAAPAPAVPTPAPGAAPPWARPPAA